MKRQQKQIIIDIMNFDEEKGFYAAANLDVDYLKAGFERLRGEVMQSDCKIVS